MKLLALGLSFVLGFLAFPATILGAGFVVYSTLSIDTLRDFGLVIETDDIFADDPEVDLEQMTMHDLLMEIQALSALGDDVSIDLLIERYGLKLDEETLAFLPAPLRSLPLAQLFAADGGNYLLENLKVGDLLVYLPEGILPDPAAVTMSDSSLMDLVNMNLGGVLEGMKLGYIVGVQYETDENGDLIKDENGNFIVVYEDESAPTLMELLAPLDIGMVLDTMSESGDGDLYGAIKESIGHVALDQMITSALKNEDMAFSGILEGKTLADLIKRESEDDPYYLDPTALLDGVSLGAMMGYVAVDEVDGDGNVVSTTWHFKNEDGTAGEQVDGMMSAFCGIEIDRLLDPNADAELGDENLTQVDVILEAFDGQTLGNIMGYVAVDEVDGDGNVVSTTWHFKNEDGTAGDQVDGMTGAFCNLGLGDLINPGEDRTQMDVILEAFDGQLLGELMGYVAVEETDSDGNVTTKWYFKNQDGTAGDAVDGMTGAFCNVSLSELLDPGEDRTQMDVILEAFDGQLLGELMGYVAVEETDVDGNVTTKWYFKNEDGTAGDAVDGMTGAFCNVSLSELLDPGEDRTQMDVILEAFDGQLLGDMMGYVAVEETDGDGNTVTNWYFKNEDGTPGDKVDGMTGAFCNVELAELLDPGVGEDGEDRTQMDVILEAFDGQLLGDMMGYVAVEETDGDGNTVTNWYFKNDDGSRGDKVDGMTGAFCNVELAELLDPGVGEDGEDRTQMDVILEAFDGQLLGDMMGYIPVKETDAGGNVVTNWYFKEEDGSRGDKVDGMTGAFCNLELAELLDPGVDEDGNELTQMDVILEAFDGQLLGDVMGYEYVVVDTDPVTGDDVYGWRSVDENGDYTELDAMTAALCDIELARLFDPGEDEDGNALTQKDILLEAFDTKSLGDLMEYYYEDGVWYVDDTKAERVDAMTAALCTITIAELLDPGVDEDGNALTQKDILLNAFDDQGTMLGDIMGYEKEAELDENGEIVYKWYEVVDGVRGNEVTGVGATVASYKLSDMMDGGFDTDDIMEDMTIASIYNLTEVTDLPVYISTNLNDEITLDDENKISVWVDEAGVPASNLIGALAPFNVESLDKEIDKIAIGDIIGIVSYNGNNYTWEYDKVNERIILTEDNGVTAEFADLSINDISNGGLDNKVKTVQIGKFLGYTYDPVTEKWYDGEISEENVVDGIMGTVAGATADNLDSTIDGTMIGDIAGFTKVEKLDSEGNPVRDENGDIVYIWYEDNTMTNEAGGILGALADLKVEQMTNNDLLSEKIKTITVADALGYEQDNNGNWYEDINDPDTKIDGIMAQIAGTPIGELNDEINDMQIGKIAGYEYKQQVDGEGNLVFDDEGNPVYAWYDGAKEATGILGALADLSVDDMTNSNKLTDKVQSITVADALGYEQGNDGNWYEDVNDPDTKIDGIMGQIACTPIGELNDEINDMQIGKIAGYEYKQQLDGEGNLVFDDEGNPVYVWYDGAKEATGILGALADLSVDDMTDSNKLTDKVQSITVADALGFTYADGKWNDANGEVTGIMAQIADKKIGSLSTEINNMTIGKMAGYYQPKGSDPENDPWYTDEACTVEATGILGALAGLTVSQLTDGSNALTDKVQSITVADALGFTYEGSKWHDGNGEVTGIMAQIADKKIGSLSTEINNMTIGKMAGYYQPEGSDPENDPWYTDEAYTNEAGGILGVMAGLTVDKMTNPDELSKKIQNVHVGDAIGYYQYNGVWYKDEAHTQKVTGLMGTIANSTISSIEDTINDQYMGDLLGYVEVGGVWYERYDPSDLSAPATKQADTLMAAVAATKFSELGTLYTKLTISDVIDEATLNSGFLVLIEKDTKLCDLGSEVNSIFQDSTLETFIANGLINIDTDTQSFLDLAAPGWRDQKLDNAFQFIINGIVEYYSHFIPGM